MICRLVDTRAVKQNNLTQNINMRYLAIPSFIVNGCSFDDDLDFDVLLGRGWPGLLRLLDRVEDAVVLRLPVALLRVDVHVHVLKS